MAVLLRKLVLLTLFLLQLGFVKAEHYSGGEITWDVINQDTIAVTTSFYSDCNSTNSVDLFFYVSDGNVREQFIPRPGDPFSTYDVTPVCKKGCGACDVGCSFKYGVRKHTFTKVIDIKHWRNKNAKKLTFWITRIYRSAGITTIGTDEEITIKATLKVTNDIASISAFENEGVIMDCLNSDVKFNLGQKDATTNITYHLTSPLSLDTSTLLSYNSPYKFNRPVRFQGWPNEKAALPSGFHLDSTNGLLQFRAKRIEQSVAAIEVRIWKNGKMVATTIRDFSIIIIKCANNNPPAISGTNCRTPDLENFDFIACGGQSNCFSICINDVDTTDSISLKRVGDTTFGSFNFYSSGNAIDSAKFCYTPAKADTGKEFQLMLNVNDNVCPIPSKSSYVYKVKVLPFYNVKFKLNATKKDSCGNYNFSVKEINNNPINDLRWYLNDTLEFGQGINAKYLFWQNGSYKITAFYKGCTQQYFDTTIKVSNLKPISINKYADTLLCSSQELEMEMQAKGGHGTLDLQWNIPSNINVLGGSKKTNNIKLGFNKIANDQSLTFSYVATDSFGCKAEHLVNALVKDYELRALENNHSFCLNGDTILPLTLFNNQTGWTGQGVKNDTFFSHLAPKQKLTLVYVNKESVRCIIDSAQVGNFEPPTLNLGKTFTICKEADDTLLSATPAKGKWTGLFIDSMGNFSPNQTNIGANYLSYFATDSNGCSNTDSLLVNIVDYKPILAVTDTAQGCINGQNLEIKAQPSGGQWSAQGFSSNKNEISINPRLFGEGTYELVYSFKDSNQCSNADTAIAIIHDLPKPDFSVDSVVFQKDTLKLENKSTEINNTVYTWIISGNQNTTETGFEPQIIMDSLGMHGITLIATDALTGCSDTLSSNDSINVILNTGLNFGQINGLKVYPNPFSQTLNFSNATGEMLHFQIISQDGKTVFEQINKKPSYSIDLSHLAKGIYTLKITSNQGVEVQQLVKE